MAAPLGCGSLGKDEGRQLLRVSAPAPTAEEAGTGAASSASSSPGVRCRRAAGLLTLTFGLLAAAALIVVSRPAPAKYGAGAAGGGDSATAVGAAAGGEPLTAVDAAAVSLVEVPEDDDAELREMQEVTCRFFSRRRRADKCTACASGPQPDPGCQPLFLHTDGFFFTFSVDLTLRDLPEDGADIFTTSTGAFRFAVEGSKEKKGVVVFQFKPLNEPLSKEEAEKRKEQMEARGEAWEEMTTTPMPKSTNDLHTPRYYWHESAIDYGTGDNRRLQSVVSDFLDPADYRSHMFRVEAPMPLSTGTTYVVTVKKNQSSLCINIKPKAATWTPFEACSMALYPETDALTLYQMLPPGDISWARTATPGRFGKQPAVQAENFRVLNDSLPFTYTVVGVEYSDIEKADLLEQFDIGMKEAISIDTGVSMDSMSLSSSVNTLQTANPQEAAVVSQIFGNTLAQVPSIYVSVTIHAIGTQAFDIREKIRRSSHLETSIAVRVAQVLKDMPQSGQVKVIDLFAPPPHLTQCGSFMCPALSKPDPSRSCIGGDCNKVCCTVDATCAEYDGCAAPYSKKPDSASLQCWGEKQCAEVCCERPCAGFDCGSYWGSKKEPDDTYCDEQPKWSLKCDGSADGSDENCGKQCCYKVKPRCCTDEGLAFCQACRTCTSRDSYCEQHGQGGKAPASRLLLQSRRNATGAAGAARSGAGKARSLLQQPAKQAAEPPPSSSAARSLKAEEELRGCEAYPPAAYGNPAWYGSKVEPCDLGLLVKFTLHSKKRPSAVKSVRVLPDFNYAVSGGEDGNVWVWRVNTGEPFNVFSQGEGKSVNAVAAMADAEHVVSGGDDDTVYVWHWKSGQAQNHFQVPSSAAGTRDGAGPLWDYPMDAATLDLDNQVQWSVVAIASADGYFRIFDFRNGNVARLPNNAKSEEELKAFWTASFDNKNSQPVFGVGGNFNYHLMQTEGTTANERETPPAHWRPENMTFGVKWGRAHAVTYVVPTGNCAVGYEDGMIRYWNAYSFHFISEFGPGKKAGPILALMAMQTLPYVISGGMDGVLRKFHVPSGKQIWAVDLGYGGAIRSVTIIPTTGNVVAGSDDGYFRMYDAGSGHPRCEQDTGGGRVNSVTFNPGRLGQIIVGNQDGNARVFQR